jgi:hypothetical protein
VCLVRSATRFETEDRDDNASRVVEPSFADSQAAPPSWLPGRKASVRWDCSFLDGTGRRFLEITFPRTALQAALRSTTQAARLIHDSRIGRVGMFHLFRLPVEKEDRVQAHMAEVSTLDVPALTASREVALDQLAGMSDKRVSAPTGPVQVGVEKNILTPAAISEMAAHYYSGFSDGFQCFPYFAGNELGRG